MIGGIADFDFHRSRVFWRENRGTAPDEREPPAPRRLHPRRPFDLERILRTGYRIDRYQDTYFVIESFEQLMRGTAPDFMPG